MYIYYIVLYYYIILLNVQKNKNKFQLQPKRVLQADAISPERVPKNSRMSKMFFTRTTQEPSFLRQQNRTL